MDFIEYGVRTVSKVAKVAGVSEIGSETTGLVSKTTSNRCGVARAICIDFTFFKSSFAISHTVSIQAEKFGGEETHSIGLVSGMPTKSGSFGRDRKRTAK